MVSPAAGGLVFITTVRQLDSTDGLTHASVVMPMPRFSSAAVGIVTRPFTPSKLSAEPVWPAVHAVPPEMVPG